MVRAHIRWQLTGWRPPGDTPPSGTSFETTDRVSAISADRSGKDLFHQGRYDMLRSIFLILTLCSSVFCSLSNAQDCAPPGIVANAKSENLFSPEQEMILGELIVQRMAGDRRLIGDERLLAYVNGISGRL